MSTTGTAQPTRQLLVNGAAQCSSARTLAQWVQEQGLAPEAVATAVNGQFVQRDLRHQCVLADGDAIVTFQPIVGG
ncbi:MAG: sulfur carrier protein ThiS [Rhodoferax sp.]